MFKLPRSLAAGIAPTEKCKRCATHVDAEKFRLMRRKSHERASSRRHRTDGATEYLILCGTVTGDFAQSASRPQARICTSRPSRVLVLRDRPAGDLRPRAANKSAGCREGALYNLP